MIKKLSVFLSVFLLVSTFCFPVYLDQRFSSSLGLGFFEPDKIAGSSYYLDSEATYGGRLRYFINPTWSLSLQYYHYNHDDYYGITNNEGYRIGTPGDDNFKEFGKGSFTFQENPFVLVFNYHFKQADNQRLIPYLGAGLIYTEYKYQYFHNPNCSVLPPQSGATLGAGQDWDDFSSSEHSWGWIAQAGIMLFTNPNFSLYAEVDYLDGDADLEIAPNLIDGEAVKEKVSGKGVFYQFGLTYYFPAEY